MREELILTVCWLWWKNIMFRQVTILQVIFQITYVVFWTKGRCHPQVFKRVLLGDVILMAVLEWSDFEYCLNFTNKIGSVIDGKFISKTHLHWKGRWHQLLLNLNEHLYLTNSWLENGFSWVWQPIKTGSTTFNWVWHNQ